MDNLEILLKIVKQTKKYVWTSGTAVLLFNLHHFWIRWIQAHKFPINLLLVSTILHCFILTPRAQFGLPKGEIRVHYLTPNTVGDPNKKQAQALQGEVTSTAWLWLASQHCSQWEKWQHTRTETMHQMAAGKIHLISFFFPV